MEEVKRCTITMQSGVKIGMMCEGFDVEAFCLLVEQIQKLEDEAGRQIIAEVEIATPITDLCT